MVLCLAESTLDIVVGLPHLRDALFVISETFLKVRTQLAQDSSICRQFIDLGTESKPSTCAQRSECSLVLFLRAVERYRDS